MNQLLRDKRVKADFTWVLAGNVFYSACQWGFVVAIAKLAGAAALGQYALAMAVSAPVILFANFQLRALLAPDVRHEYSFGEYLSFRLATLSIALIIVCGLAMTSASDWESRTVIILVSIAVMLDYWSDTYYGIMQQYDRIDRMSRSLMCKGPLSLSLLCGLLYLTQSVVWAACGLIAGRLLVLTVWDSRLNFVRDLPKAAMRLHWDKDRMLRLLRLALPLGLVSMLLSLNSNIPRYFLKANQGTVELGMYSAIASLLTIGSMIVSAYGQSIFMPVARSCADNDAAKYRNCIALVVVLGALLGGSMVMGSLLFGRTLLVHLFRPEYGAYADILVQLMIAGTVWFIGNGLGYIMTASRSLRVQVPLLLVTLSATTAVSAWSIPLRGLRGAVDATLAAAIVQLIGTSVVLWRIHSRLEAGARRQEDAFPVMSPRPEQVEVRT